jgi:hypothetical protein
MKTLDVIKDDLYIWCLTSNDYGYGDSPFRTDQQIEVTDIEYDTILDTFERLAAVQEFIGKKVTGE